MTAGRHEQNPMGAEMSSEPSLITRLAPSPTGAQHVGNARTYLIAWLYARQRGGRIVLRIEDIDSPRVKTGAAAEAMDDLHWLGLDWDDGPIIQTARLSCYSAALDRLKKGELVYPCSCTRSDIEQAASAPHPSGVEPIYPGTCSGLSVRDADALSGQPFAWRYRVTNVPSFVDEFHGTTEFSREQIGGDFVAWKSKDSPAYQLAVVVDDAAGGITHVIRGDDLLSSTPRQLMLYRSLGLAPPRFVHVPLVVGPDGRRLAKRHGDTRLSALRTAGVSAESLIGLLAASCGWIARPSPISAQDLIPRFDLGSIPRRPFVLDGAALSSIGYQP